MATAAIEADGTANTVGLVALCSVLATVGLLLALGGILQETLNIGLLRQAARLETGGRFNQIPPPSTWRRPVAVSLSRFCEPNIQRSFVSVRLGLVDRIARDVTFIEYYDEALDQAATALRQLLRCVPADGNAWMRLAMIDLQRLGLSQGVIHALKNSYLNAPNEGWVIRARIPFAATLYAAGLPSTEADLILDIDRLLSRGSSAEIALLYKLTSSAGRTLFEHSILRLSPERQSTIRLAIEKLGIRT
jgi:hypothetical protein